MRGVFLVEICGDLGYYGYEILAQRGRGALMNFIEKFNAINWDAVSAIGTCVGGIATVAALVVALYPFLRKGRIYFSEYSNIEKKMVVSIVNSKDQGMLIEKIVFFAGPPLFQCGFLSDMFLEQQDDLISDKTDVNSDFIEPFGKKKIIYEPSRIIYYILHRGGKIGLLCHLNVRIIAYTNLGKIKIRTKCRTKDFLARMLIESDSYKDININQLIN